MLLPLRATIAGVRGVVATTSYSAGDIVLKLCGRITSIPSDSTIALDHGSHILDPRVDWARADATSNVAVRKGFLLASRPISPGDEIKLPFSRKTSSDP